MPATQTMTGSPKKAKRDKKQPGDSIAKSKVKTPKDMPIEATSPPKPSKGKKRKEESVSVIEADQGADLESGKKLKKAKKIQSEVVVEDITAEKKVAREKKQKGVTKGKDIAVEIGDAQVKAKNVGNEDAASEPLKSKSKKAKKTTEEDVAELPSKLKKPSKKTKQPTPEPTPEASENEQDAEGSQLGGSDDGHLHGFSTDDDDSSDEEDAMHYEPEGLDLAKLPTIAKDDFTVKRKLEKAKREPAEDKGVIYIGRLPHGFFEDQLRGYFSQFGDVTRLRLSRNKKNGGSKHYAFLEFDSSSVAKIVAETMDNYLLMGHLLRCEVIPKKQVHPELWVGANKKWKKVPINRIERIKHDKPRTEDEIKQAETRLIKRQNEKKRKIEEAGIKYDFDAVAYKKKSKTVKA